MAITDQQSQILSLVELDAETPITKLQKQTNFRSHTIHYALHRLQQLDIIKKVPFIDMKKLGYLDFALYFSLATGQSNKRKEILDYLLTSPVVTWVGELGGDFQYGLAMYVKTLPEFLNFLNELSEKFGDVFFQKSFSLHTSFVRFNRKYLHPQTVPMNISVETPDKIVILDDLDKKILWATATYPDHSRRELANTLKIPFSTLNKRVNALEKKEILKGYVYFVDPTKLRMQTFNFLIYAKGLPKKLKKQLLNFSEKHQNIIHLVECIGEWDFEIGVEVEKNADTTKILQELYESFGEDIRTIKTVPVFKNVKYLFYRDYPEGTETI